MRGLPPGVKTGIDQGLTLTTDKSTLVPMNPIQITALVMASFIALGMTVAKDSTFVWACAVVCIPVMGWFSV